MRFFVIKWSMLRKKFAFGNGYAEIEGFIGTVEIM